MRREIVPVRGLSRAPKRWRRIFQLLQAAGVTPAQVAARGDQLRAAEQAKRAARQQSPFSMPEMQEIEPPLVGRRS